MSLLMSLLKYRLKRVGIDISNGLYLAPAMSIDLEAPLSMHKIDLNTRSGIIPRIGAHTYIRSGCHFTAFQEIGRFCSIGPSLRCGDPNHPLNLVSTHPFAYQHRPPDDAVRKIKDPPKIGHDVWIGSNVIILSGVNIATGAVIAAGAVVSKDIAPYEIVGGVPARHIRFRFSPEIIEKLLATQWWDYEPKALLNFDFSNPEAFIEQFSAAKLQPASYPLWRIHGRGKRIERLNTP
jgi:acetyltransferase-like isoleucine patch superfamily enzyme